MCGRCQQVEPGGLNGDGIFNQRIQFMNFSKVLQAEQSLLQVVAAAGGHGEQIAIQLQSVIEIVLLHFGVRLSSFVGRFLSNGDQG